MLRIVSIALVFVSFSFTQAQESVGVVASVADIRVSHPPEAGSVHIMLLVHTPTEFRGLKIQFNDENLSRADARKTFPIGSTFAFSVPLSVVDMLKQERQQDEHVQRQLDGGIDPRMISQIVMPAQLKSSDLSTPPAAVTIP